VKRKLTGLLATKTLLSLICLKVPYNYMKSGLADSSSATIPDKTPKSYGDISGFNRFKIILISSME
jgi:hypothetical protein